MPLCGDSPFEFVALADLETMILNFNVLREQEAALTIEREAAEYLSRPNALFFLAPSNVIRRWVHKLISSKILDWIVIPVILISCVLMAMDVPGADSPAWMEIWDRAALAIFTVEMALKSIDLGFVGAPNAYLLDGWNRLDFFVVVTGFLDIILSSVLAGSSSLAGLKAMRLLRTLRPLRLISRAQGMKECFNCLVTSIPAGAQVSILLSLGALGFAVVAVTLFSGKFHICTDGQLWTAAVVTSWTRTNATGPEKILVQDWLDCVGGAGKSWMPPPMHYDDVSVALKSLFETATFSGYSDSLVPAIMGNGRGLQPAWASNDFVSIPACTFFFLWLVLGGLVVCQGFCGSFCRAVASSCRVKRCGRV
jgi:voltage-dependent calcium channel T type alpha-1G